MQSDKDKEKQPGQPPQQDAGGGVSEQPVPPPPPPKQKKGLFGMKGPQKPKQSKAKKPKPPKVPGKNKEKPPKSIKGPKKPLFSFSKKKPVPMPPPSVAPSAVTTGSQEGVQRVTPEAAPGAKPEKKQKKPRAQKVKKPKPPKGQKKPFFSFKKTGGKPVPTSESPDRLVPSDDAGKQDGSPTAGSKGMFGKKGPKQPRVKEPKAPRAKKTKSATGGFGSSKMSPVGLDLGRSSLTAVRLRYQTGGSIMLQAANDTLPEGLIQEGEVRDVEALSFAIREFWKTHNIKGKKVSLGLANQKVVVRTLEFPMLDAKELRSAIEFQAQDYIPIPIEEAVFDFHVLSKFTDEEGIEKQKVLVVAAQKVMVMDFINAIKGAKLTIAGVDLQAFALLRALAPVSFLDQSPGDRATAIANIGSDVTNLVVDKGGEPQFTRIISFGGDDFTKALQDLQGISFVDAEQLKNSTGLSDPASRVEHDTRHEWLPGSEDFTQELPGEGPEIAQGSGPEQEQIKEPEFKPGPEFPVTEQPGTVGSGDQPEGPWPAGPPVEAESEQEMKLNVQRTLESIADSLAEEIRRSLDYYVSQEQSAPIGRLLISGGGAMLKNLDTHLAQLFPFSVETGNPMMRISENKSDLTDEQLQALAPQLAIAIGLALEDEG